MEGTEQTILNTKIMNMVLKIVIQITYQENRL